MKLRPDQVKELPRETTQQQLDDAAKLHRNSMDLTGAFDIGLTKGSFRSHPGDDDLAVQTFLDIEKRRPTRSRTQLLVRARSYLNSEMGAGIATLKTLHIANVSRRLGSRIGWR